MWGLLSSEALNMSMFCSCFVLHKSCYRLSSGNHTKLPAQEQLIFLANTLLTYLFSFKVFFFFRLKPLLKVILVTWSCYWKVLLGENLQKMWRKKKTFIFYWRRNGPMRPRDSEFSLMCLDWRCHHDCSLPSLTWSYLLWRKLLNLFNKSLFYLWF